MYSNTDRRQAGLTLVELMISLIIASIAVAASLALGFSLNNTYSTQRKMGDVARSARSSLDFIVHTVRSASPAVPTGNLEDLVGCDDNIHGLFVTNNPGGSDILEVIYGTGGASAGTPTQGVVTSLRAAHDGVSTTLDVFDTTGFIAGDYVTLSNLDQGVLIPVEAVPDINTITLRAGVQNLCAGAPPNTFPAGGYVEGSLVVRSGLARFMICPASGSIPAAEFLGCPPPPAGGVQPIPILFMDSTGDGPQSPLGGGINEAPIAGVAPLQPMALGIEDLQIAVGVDVNGDGQISENGAALNDDEWSFNCCAGNGTSETVPVMTATTWRALRITIVARSVTEESSQVDSPNSFRPQIEDHAAGTPDVFRRRVMTTTVEIRNLGQ